MNLQDAAARVKAVNVANGWYDDARSFGDDIALLHSEVSEAFEEYRGHGVLAFVRYADGSTGTAANAQYGGMKPLGVPSELADVLVRLLDTCDRYDIDLEAEFEAKLAYNATRGYKHGNKLV